MKGSFATAITCMDGRVQEPVSIWAKHYFNVDFVDTITEPGADLLLTESLIWQDDKIKSRVVISVEKHGSQNIVIVGHYDCAGNPVEKDVHIEMIKKSVETIKGWEMGVRIVGLWVDEAWQANVVCEYEPGEQE